MLQTGEIHTAIVIIPSQNLCTVLRVTSSAKKCIYTLALSNLCRPTYELQKVLFNIRIKCMKDGTKHATICTTHLNNIMRDKLHLRQCATQHLQSVSLSVRCRSYRLAPPLPHACVFPSVSAPSLSTCRSPSLDVGCLPLLYAQTTVNQLYILPLPFP